MTPVLGVAQMALTVTDLARAKAFYCDVLGLAPLFDAGKMSSLDCRWSSNRAQRAGRQARGSRHR